MASRLKQSPKIWKLAKDLGIQPSDDPVSDILRYCEKEIKKFLRGVSDCNTLSDFLNWVAGKLGTSFEEIHGENDLNRIKTKYLRMGEKVFANLDQELSDEVCGITFRRVNRESWEPQFISIIDCRGINEKKAYYTKWHELAHLLILTNQMRLSFRRTLHLSDKDPEEVLVDTIAGNFGFYSSLIRPHISGEMSFERIDFLRQSLCPDASYQSSLIGFVKAWPDPCMLLLCRLGLKRSEKIQCYQQGFDFKKGPTPVLRAVKVTSNEAARERSFVIHENMRVPEPSVIYSVHERETDYAEAIEDLSWWETSAGMIFPKLQIFVKAKRIWEDIYVLVIPNPKEMN